MAAIDRVNVNNVDYEIVPEIAPLFKTTQAYSTGDCVIKDAKLYKFKTNHTAGEWVASEVEQVVLGTEVTGLPSQIVKVQNSEPSSTKSRIWVKESATEYEIPTMDEFGELSDEVDDLKSDLDSLDSKLTTVELSFSENISGATIMPEGVAVDVVLNGPSTELYDGTVLIDGENVKFTSVNGQSTNYNFFFISSGQINKANGNDFITDTFPVTASGDIEKVIGRTNNSAVEFCLLKTKCEYSVSAANAYVKQHPIRMWFKTPNNSTATTFYPYINATKTGVYLNIGTTQPVSQLLSGDTLSFVTGDYSIGGNSGKVDISQPASDIPSGSTLISTGNLTIKTLIDLQGALDKKVSRDGWNEVLPINTTFFDGVNYFDLSKAIVYNDRFINNSGTVTSAADLTSVVCPVKPNTTYWFYAPGMNRFFVVENDSATFNIGSSYTVLHNNSETNPTSITTGATARYVCIYFANYTYDFMQNNPILNEKLYNGTNNPYVSEDYLPKAVTNPLRNANVLIFGDSITDSCHITVNANDETTAYTWKNPSNSYTDAGGNIVRFNMWPFMLKNLGVFSEIRDYARSGASYKDATRTAGEERQNLSYQITVALNDLDNPNGVFDVDEFVPDIVIFALGTNDGLPNDTYQEAMAKTVLKSDGYSIDTDATLANLDRSKFCEAARSAFLRTRIAFPEAQFYCVLPIQRANDEVNGQNLNTYLREMARRYGCVIIDGYAESGIIRDTNVWNALGATLKDGLHPNDKGQNMMFRMIYGALKSHYIKDNVMN